MQTRHRSFLIFSRFDAHGAGLLTSMVTTIFNMQFTRGDLSESDASARHIPWLVTLSLFFFCLLASTSQSWADDYDVDFGVEAQALRT